MSFVGMRNPAPFDHIPHFETSWPMSLIYAHIFGYRREKHGDTYVIYKMYEEYTPRRKIDIVWLEYIFFTRWVESWVDILDN